MKHQPVSKECLICGTTFHKTKTKSWKEWNETAKYCSRRCSAISVRGVTISRNKLGLSLESKIKIGRANTGRVKSQESIDKQRESVKKHWTKENRLKQSRKVLAAQTPEVRLKKSLAHRGAKAHNWKGGRTSLKHRMRTNTKYIEWRTAVFTRDSFTCTHCGDNTGGNLEADHIITVENIFDVFKIININSVIENFLLWEVSNGRTLCKECHIKRHNRVV